jgi:hypothetical protein
LLAAVPATAQEQEKGRESAVDAGGTVLSTAFSVYF